MASFLVLVWISNFIIWGDPYRVESKAQLETVVWEKLQLSPNLRHFVCLASAV